jgi:tetrapyrrole methylase family protein/MazG family protein
MDELNTIMEKLLGPDGCPWDREQTHESLCKHMLEEAQEAVDAVGTGDFVELCEELGDVLLQVVFHAKLAEKAGRFTLDDVIAGLCGKLVRRHSHVFGGEKAVSAEDAYRIWNENKALEGKNHPKA